MDRKNGVAVFSGTNHYSRHEVGDRMTQWIADNPSKRPVSCKVSQTSDDSHHCLTIVLFYSEGST